MFETVDTPTYKRMTEASYLFYKLIHEPKGSGLAYKTYKKKMVNFELDFINKLFICPGYGTWEEVSRESANSK